MNVNLGTTRTLFFRNLASPRRKSMSLFQIRSVKQGTRALHLHPQGAAGYLHQEWTADGSNPGTWVRFGVEIRGDEPSGR
jgi:hypothetical protein